MTVLIEKRSEPSEKRVERLKQRKKYCRCKYCGGVLKLRRIIFSDFEEARIELYCNHCNRIEYGVEWEIYQSAKFYVEHSGINLFPRLEANEQRHQMNIAKTAEIMAWVTQNLGLVDEHGFTVPLHFHTEFMSECTTITNAELENLDEDNIEDLIAID